MRLGYTLPALADLDQILVHIAARSPKGAVHVQARIKAITDLLLDYPRIGAMTRDPTHHDLTISLSHLLRSRGRRVIIHAVRHGARDPLGMPGSD